MLWTRGGGDVFGLGSEMVWESWEKLPTAQREMRSLSKPRSSWFRGGNGNVLGWCGPLIYSIVINKSFRKCHLPGLRKVIYI